MLNALHTIVPSMVGREQPLWGELAGVLGDAGAFEPAGKARRWTTFFGSGSAFGTELRSEIQRAKRTFQEAQRAAGLADPEPHPIFDVPDQAFGVSAEEGGGDVPKLHKRMTDSIRELQKDAVLSRAQALDLDDARRTPYCQAGLSKCHNTLHCNAPTQRKQFATREEWQTAVLRSLGVPVRAIHGLFALGIKPKRRDEPTSTVDAEGNNLFMGDDQRATNEGGRGLRTHNIVVDWLSHWFHVAGIKHKGGFRGRPDTCKGLFGRECQRLRMTPRAGESEKTFQERCDRLLNALIPDLVIDLFGTELKDPTRRLQELLDGRQHLIDVKTVVPGEGYRRAAASTAAHVNWRQEEVTKGYARKARECDGEVPGDDTPFADKLASYGEEGRVLGPTVGCWCETSSDFDLLVELIAHVLADKETSVVQVAHHQAVARQRQKLVADFGVTMHIAWARHMLDNREFVVGGGAQPGTEPVRVGGLDGSAAAEERDNYHRDAYTNDRNHASGAPRPGCE